MISCLGIAFRRFCSFLCLIFAVVSSLSATDSTKVQIYTGFFSCFCDNLLYTRVKLTKAIVFILDLSRNTGGLGGAFSHSIYLLSDNGPIKQNMPGATVKKTSFAYIMFPLELLDVSGSFIFQYFLDLPENLSLANFILT